MRAQLGPDPDPGSRTQTTHPGAIRLDGDTASGRAYIQELIGFRDGSSELNYAIYHDRYQRTPDGWKFAERVYEIRYLDTTPLAGSAPPPRLRAPASQERGEAGGRAGEPSGGAGDRSLAGVNGRPGAVASPARDGPGQHAGRRLFQPPAGGLLGLVVPTAQRSEVALTSQAAMLEWCGVVEVALASGTATSGEGASLLPDPDQVLQRRRRPVGR
jgi:hypothetical protein